MTDACRICGNSSSNRPHTAREMMFGTRIPYDYVECGECGTLKIVEAPDPSQQYPADYYSFSDSPLEIETPKNSVAARRIGEYLSVTDGSWRHI